MDEDQLKSSRLAAFEKPDRTRAAAGDNQKNGNILSFLKVALLVVAAILAVVTFSWTFFTQEDYQQGPSIDLVETLQKNEVVKPRFDSTDSQGRPFTLTAQSALRNDEQGGVVLQSPAGDIRLRSDRWLSAQAVRGVYDEEAKQLELLEKVRLFDSQGYSLSADQMFVDFAADTLRIDSAVSSQGPTGTLKAVSAAANISDGVLTFNGPATLRLYGHTLKGGIGGLK